MPIYAYKCASCGYAKDVLQKISDAPLAVCPQCGAAAFQKQLTAAGFQLKGSGWYVTDFRGGGAAPAADKDGKAEAKPDAKPDAKGGEAAQPKSDSKSEAQSGAAAPAPAASASPASGSAASGG
jgi:putative FmdB family regulatory protein